MARKKRSDSEGSVYYSRARGCWVAQLDRDPLTGKRPLRTADTEKAALELLRQMRTERAGGRDLTVKQPTLDQLAALWLAESVQPSKKASTHASYEQVYRLYIAPTLGRLKVETITPPLVQRWANALLENDISPATVRNAYARLRAMLHIAVRWRYIAHNPALEVDLPKLPPSIAAAYTLEEVQALIKGAADWRLEGLLWALLLLGLRKGEALGLAWRDLDWKAGTIKITQQVQLINKQVVISPTTKTEDRRVLPVPPGLLVRFRRAWEDRQIERKFHGEAWKEHGLIFPSEQGTPIQPRNFNRAFTALCTRSGVPAHRVHDLRHTTATLLGELGEQKATIAALLGHSAATITEHYMHLVRVLRAAVERLEQVLESGEAKEKSG